MKTLVAVAHSKQLPAALNSIEGMAVFSGLEVLYLRDGDDPQAHRYDNCTRKYEQARRIALAESYDALMFVDDDQVVPLDAYQRLAALNVDVAYGLTVWRNAPHAWSAVLAADGDDHITTVDMAGLTAQLWGQVIDVHGCGFFCTLFRRHVLEQVVFERRGRHCADWYFDQDCDRLGFSRKADLSVVCGHITDDPPGVLWPTPQGWRLENA